MRTIAVLPVKSFRAAKQRLAGTLTGGSRQALAQSMFSDVLASLRHMRGLDAIAVVTADREVEVAAFGEGVHILRDVERGGQSPAALVGVRYAIASKLDRVLLVPGDTPLVEARELEELLEWAAAEELQVAVVPDRHGSGTNALLLRPPDAMAPSFGPGSLERHVQAAQAAGLRHAVRPVPSLALDVDTPEDLTELAGVLEKRRGQAPMTRGVLRQLDRLSRPSPARPPRAALQV